MNKESTQLIIHLIIGIGAGLATFFVSWDGWLSVSLINSEVNTASAISSIDQHLTDLDQKADAHWGYASTTQISSN